MNHVLAAAPNARVTCGAHGALMMLDDLAEWQPHQLNAGQAIDLGGRQIIAIPTPHAPHAFETHAFLEMTTSTMFCADILTQAGRGPAITTNDLVDPAIETEALLQSAPPGPAVPRSLRRLASYRPKVLAVLHGSSFNGDASAALQDLADAWELRFATNHPPDT
jgi:flavorubredoxin